MYFHARQFPHLAGKSDAEIYDIAQRAMRRNPGLGRAMRIRNLAIYFGIVAAGAWLFSYSNWSMGGSSMVNLGVGLIIVGVSVTAIVLAWNLVWLNTVVFRITRDEVEANR